MASLTMAVKATTFNPLAKLLKCSVPIWPTQLHWYTETSLLISRPEVHGDWEENIYPSGATYDYNNKMVAHSLYENIDDIHQIEPADLCGSMYQELNYTEECTAAWYWNHKRLELKAQFWKHMEYFPFEIDISLKEEMASELVIASMHPHFNLHCQVDNQRTEELVGPNGVMDVPDVTICGKLLHVIHMLFVSNGLDIKLNTQEGHHQYLHHYGQPKACLMQMHSLDIYVNGLISGVYIKAFMDNFSTQSKAQMTMASVIMAVNASILAIPGILYAREDVQTYHPHKYTKLSVLNKVTKP
ncbi:hypothetical protein BDR04DRAFT_1119042 [Suillus decipiens]|nr:hypothetical protein BDR04DRAFT_1119042 [Suillus decipiens]